MGEVDIAFALGKEVEEVVDMDKAEQLEDNKLDLVEVEEVSDTFDTAVAERDMDKVGVVGYNMEVGRSSCSGVHI